MVINQRDPFTAIAAEAQALVQAETAVLALAEAGGSQVYYAAAVGPNAAAIVDKRGSAAASGLCGTTFEAGEAVLVCRTQGDPRVRQDQVDLLGIESALSVPVFYEGILLGAIMALNRADGQPFTPAAETLLTAYGDRIAPDLYRLLTAQFE